MAGKDVDFRALYQNSLKLTTAIDDFGIPRLEKSLDQLDDASRSFFHQQPQPTATLKKKRPASSSAKVAVDKANFLLAAKGIDAEKLSKELQAFELTSGFEPETPLGETDIEGYLTHHHEMIILTAIEDVNRRTMEATHDRMNQAMIDDFELAKQQLLEELGSSKQLGVRNYPRIVENLNDSNVFAARNDDQREQQVRGFGISGASFNGQPRFDVSQSGSFFSPDGSVSRNEGPLNLSQLGVDNQLSEEMKLYYSVIRDLNGSRIPGARTQFDVVGSFQRICADNVSASTVGSKWEAVLKCWQVVNNMLAGGDVKNRSRVISEREFASLYEQDEAQRMLVEQRFAYGARVFLENQFRGFVQQTVQKNHLPTGGIPDLVSSVRAFVKYMQSASGISTTDNDVDIWALLYYCVRCGGEQEAIDLATSYMRAGNSPIDENVLCGLRYRAHQTRAIGERGGAPLNVFSKQFPAEYSRLVDRYHRLTSSSIDAVAVVNPYERCVINILCFGNPNASEPRIMTTIEDYLWQRLCFIQRVAPSTAAPDSAYTIARLAKSIHKFGPSHFEGSKATGSNAYSPFLFFEILLIAQDFEAAIKYIGSRGFLLEAAHFAIALNHYGLLRCSPFPSNEEDEYSVDFIRLVRQYVHGFQRTNPCEAAEYIACISDVAAKKELFSDLLLETRKFDVLAGFTNNTDGSRTRGLYDRLLKDVSEDEIRELILNAARKAEAHGRPHDAYALLKCAGDIEGTISLLNVQLSSTLSAPRPEREEWFRVAKEFAEKWMRFPWVQSVANKYARSGAVAFQTLLNINIFLEIYERQQYDDAIRFVDELEVIPTPSANNLAVCVDRFLAFDETVRQNFHVLLLGYVECLVRDMERLKVQTTGEVRRVSVQTLREKAELVVTFAGMVKFRLPSGTNERLNRMEAMIY
ncbi:hypothetical protein Poli38472_006647 [Pythium oligandrum]|uniref:Nuclear pore protein n=1 Tax=Pythium oligandrum TaxID=41045 RepID=A0A8K1C5W4_PYTOL|nr:hypothetical protein Poli38472_006647 [Pythium oligandrum]|eukprot:TMW56637.1 hypothetical protein Poli38472_006647 [Pythium oligandrum]